MDKVLSIISLFSVVWSNILLIKIGDAEYFRGLPGSIGGCRTLLLMYSTYVAVLVYNTFTIFFCRKVQRKKQGSKLPGRLSMTGTILFLVAAFFLSLGVSFVEFTGGV